MFSGDYQNSLENMIRYAKKKKEVESEWILKIFILDFIVNELKIKKQNRDYTRALKDSDGGDKENVSEKTLMRAIKLDALSPLAWYNLGQLYYKDKKYEKAFIAFLITSLVNEYDPEAWFNTIVSLFYSQRNVELLENIIRTGYRKAGEEFIRSMHSIGNKFSFNGMDDFLDSIIQEENQETEAIVRVYNGTRFEEIT
jgi:tetratricopeptide (TPR) repeat protein